MQLSTALPAVIGMLASLMGVALGAMLTRRVQTLQWSRERLTHACTVIMSESSRIQISLHRYWKSGDRPEWIAWNEALATVSLVAPSELVHAALEIDETFWRTTDEIEAGRVRSAGDWERVRASIERSRLGFANLARSHLAGRNDVVTRLAARPPLTQASSEGTADE
ncbi:hypothetical protein ACWDA3_47630 [Nonomuraea rubra]